MGLLRVRPRTGAVVRADDRGKPRQPTAPEAPRRKSARRYRFRRVSYTAAMYLLLLGLCAIILLPVGWMLTAALKPDLEPVFTPKAEWYPTKFWEWGNFRRALTDNMPFLRYMINTMIIVIVNIIGVLISCSLVGFPRSRGFGSGGARFSSTSSSSPCSSRGRR